MNTSRKELMHVSHSVRKHVGKRSYHICLNHRDPLRCRGNREGGMNYMVSQIINQNHHFTSLPSEPLPRLQILIKALPHISPDRARPGYAVCRKQFK